jgi:hypothetical protein
MKIKYTFIAFILSAIAFSSSCKKTLNDISFSKDYANAEFVIDTTSMVGVFELGTFTTKTDILSTLEADGFTVNNLKNVTLTKATVSNVNSSQNLNYFRSLQIRTSNSLGADEVTFADVQLPEETTQSRVDLISKGVELKEVFKDSQIQFSLNAETDLQILPNPVPLKVSLTFQVKAALGN